MKELLAHVMKYGYDEDYINWQVNNIISTNKQTKFRGKKPKFSLEDLALSYIITIDQMVSDFVDMEQYETCADLIKTKEYVIAEFGRYKIDV